jgi:ABC-type antimicrobial peptide transport system permease subunit
VGFALVPASFAIAFGVLVVCTLGAVPPARKVSRLSIVDAMRIE